MKKSAAGYLRCSTDKQETSIVDQKNAISKYASENNYMIIRWYVDDAVSGTSTHGRKQFLQMIKDSESKTFSAILVWDVRRFSRGDIDEAGYYRYLLRQNGVEVVYIIENLRGDDTDSLILSIKQHLAKQESKDKGRDTLRGHLPRILQGHGNNGVPYGYARLLLDRDGKAKGVFERGTVAGQKASGDKSKLTLGAPNKVEMVRRIFDMYVNGMGMRLIARKLNQEGVPSALGKKWSCASVETILKNPTYTGKSVWNRSGRGKFYKVIKEGKEYTIRERGQTVSQTYERYAKENWFVYENAHEPIISQKLFDRAQAVRKSRACDKSLWGRGSSSKYLLTGMIRCARCGRRLSIVIRKQPYKTYLYWSCEGCKTRESRGGYNIPAEKIETHIIEKLRSDLFDYEEMRTIIDGVKEGFGTAVSSDKLVAGEIDKKLKENEEKIDRLLDAVDPRHKDLLNKKLDDLRGEREGLKQKQAESKTEVRKINTGKLEREIMLYLKDSRRVLDSGLNGEKKIVMRSCIESIVSDPTTKEATISYYRIPKCPATEPLFNLYLCSRKGATRRPR
ncbi:MAG: recombinase family protein [Candidatus Omnitrophota bacterium]